jgi:NTP pyrophosphatase (non-canonical NTP hydrolase)
MSGNLTVKGFQEYIKSFDHQPDKKNDYFLKLVEEVGELADVLRKNKRLNQTGNIKGTVEEELYDIFYYVSALANIYQVDLEECYQLKEEINRKKYKNKSE